MRNPREKLRRIYWWTRTPLSDEELDRCLADFRSVLDDEPAFREQILRELFGKTGQRPPSGPGQPERCTAVVCAMSRGARQARRLASPAEHGQRRGCGRALPPGPVQRYAVDWTDGPNTDQMRRFAASHAEEISKVTVAHLVWRRSTNRRRRPGQAAAGAGR
jgi:hypothetical protein